MLQTCYVLHVMQQQHRQFLGIHFLTLFLKLDRKYASLVFCVTSSHIFAARIVMDLFPNVLHAQ